MKSAVCILVQSSRGFLLRVSFYCVLLKMNAKGVINDAIVGSIGLGQCLYQTSFQKCF